MAISLRNTTPQYLAPNYEEEPVPGVDPQEHFLSRALQRGGLGLRADANSMVESLARVAGAEEMAANRAAAAEQARQQAAALPREVASLRQIYDPESALNTAKNALIWGAETGVEQAPLLGTMAAGGIAGRALGAAARLGETGRKVATAAGGAIPYETTSVGSLYDRLKRDNPDTPPEDLVAPAWTGGTAATTLGMLPFGAVANRLVRPGLTATQRAAQAAGMGAVTEGLTETGEEVIANLTRQYENPEVDPWDAEAMWDYLESGVAGAVLGGAMGGVGGAVAPGPQAAETGVTDTPPPAAPPQEMFEFMRDIGSIQGRRAQEQANLENVADALASGQLDFDAPGLDAVIDFYGEDFYDAVERAMDDMENRQAQVGGSLKGEDNNDSIWEFGPNETTVFNTEDRPWALKEGGPSDSMLAAQRKRSLAQTSKEFQRAYAQAEKNDPARLKKLQARLDEEGEFQPVSLRQAAEEAANELGIPIREYMEQIYRTDYAPKMSEQERAAYGPDIEAYFDEHAVLKRTRMSKAVDPRDDLALTPEQLTPELTRTLREKLRTRKSQLDDFREQAWDIVAGDMSEEQVSNVREYVRLGQKIAKEQGTKADYGRLLELDTLPEVQTYSERNAEIAPLRASINETRQQVKDIERSTKPILDNKIERGSDLERKRIPVTVKQPDGKWVEKSLNPQRLVEAMRGRVDEQSDNFLDNLAKRFFAGVSSVLNSREQDITLRYPKGADLPNNLVVWTKRDGTEITVGTLRKTEAGRRAAMGENTDVMQELSELSDEFLGGKLKAAPASVGGKLSKTTQNMLSKRDVELARALQETASGEDLSPSEKQNLLVAVEAEEDAGVEPVGFDPDAEPGIMTTTALRGGERAAAYKEAYGKDTPGGYTATETAAAEEGKAKSPFAKRRAALQARKNQWLPEPKKGPAAEMARSTFKEQAEDTLTAEKEQGTAYRATLSRSTKLVRAWAKKLGITRDVRVVGAAEYQELLQARNTSAELIPQALAAAGGAINDANTGGIAIYLSPTLDSRAHTEVLGHEMGHVVISEVFNALPKRAQEAVRKSFAEWLGQINENTTVMQVAYSRMPANAVSLFDMAADMRRVSELDEKDAAYLLAFDEWFSDNTARWLNTKAEPRNFVEQFFAHMADMLKALMDAIGLNKPDQAVAEFLDGLWSGTVQAPRKGLLQRLKDSLGLSMMTEAKTPQESENAEPETPVPDRIMEQTVEALKKRGIQGKRRNPNAGNRRRAGRTAGYNEAEGLVILAGVANEDTFGEAMNASLRAAFASEIFTPEEAGIIQRVFTRSTVMRQLRDKLKDAPAALREIQKSPEAAAAYAYQFWVAGELKIGPDLNNIFQLVTDIIRDILGIIRQDTQAEQILRAFEDGTLAARKDGTGEFVVRKRVTETLLQKARGLAEQADKVIRPIMGKLAYTSAGRLRATKNPWAEALADQFYTVVGSEGKGEGMLAARVRMRGRFEQIMHNIFDGEDEAFGRAMADVLNGVRDPRTDREIETYDKISKLMHEIYVYSKEGGTWIKNAGATHSFHTGDIEDADGPPLRWYKINDYFPRSWDAEYLQRNKDRFVAMMLEERNLAGLDAFIGKESPTAQDRNAAVERIYQALIRNYGESQTAGEELREEIGLGAPKAGSSESRVLDWLEKYDVAEFMSKDLGLIMSKYINQMVKRTEYKRRFGKGVAGATTFEEYLAKAKATGASDQDLRTMEQAMKAMMGTLGSDIDPTLHKLQGALMVYQNWTVLALSTITSLVDPLGIAVRGDLDTAWSAFKAGLREVRAAAQDEKTELKKLAEMLGTIERNTAIEALGYEYGGYYVTGKARQLNDLLFRVNGLESWTRTTRLLALAGAKKFLEKHGNFTAHKHSKRFMEQLGLREGDVQLDARGNVRILSHVERVELEQRTGARQWDDPNLEKHMPARFDGGRPSTEEVNDRFNSIDLRSAPDSVLRTLLEQKIAKIADYEGRVEFYRGNSMGLSSEAAENNADDLARAQQILENIQQEKARVELALRERERAGNVSAREAQAELERDDRVRVALNRWVDEAILRPDAAQRPIWASDPHWMLVFHLKAFTYSFYDRILRRVGSEIMQGNFTPLLYLSGYVPTMLAADAFRAVLQDDDDDREETFTGAIDRGMQRAGLYGPAQFARDALQDVQYGHAPAISLLGPTFQHGTEIAEAMVSDNPRDDVKAIFRSLPAGNFYKDWGDDL